MTAIPQLDLLACHVTVSPDALESRVGDETVLLHLDSGTYFGLNGIGTEVWEMIKQGVCLADGCTGLAAAYAVPIAEVEADVRSFLGDLVAHQIITATAMAPNADGLA